MAEYKKQAQTAPKQNAQAPVVRAKIERLITDEESKVKAYASVTIGGMFAVHGVRVTADLRHQLTQTVMTAYDQALQQAQQQGVKETQDNAPKIKPEM